MNYNALSEKVQKHLVVLFQEENDQDAFLEIYDLLFQKIYNFFSFKVSGRDIAEDLTQDVFLKFVKNIDKFEWRGEGSFEAWIFRIAHNTLSSFYRKNKKTQKISLEKVEFELEHDPELLNKSEAKELLRFLDKLKDGYKEMLILKYVDQLKIEEIAEMTGRSISSVKVTLMRARNKLEEIYTKSNQN